jgi:hypothetical protein
MAFGTATAITNAGVAVQAKRMVSDTPTAPFPVYIGMGVGATGAARTAAIGDTVLSSPVESRVTGSASTVTTTVTNDTYQCVGTVTASTARAVDEAGLFDASTSGNMMISATFAVQNLANGDSIQFTFKNKFVANAA